MAKDDFTREQIKLLEKCGEQYLIAKLQGSNAFQEVAGNGAIRIYLEQLCDDPLPIDKLGYNDGVLTYVLYDNAIQGHYLPDNYRLYDDVETKIEVLREKYQDKLFVIMPTYLGPNNQKSKQAYIYKLLDNVPNDYDYFDVVPYIDMDHNDFEKKLKNGEYFDMSGYNGAVNYDPLMVICDGYVYRSKNPTENQSMLIYSQDNAERWRCIDANNVVKIYVGDILNNDKIIDVELSVCFIQDDYRNDLLLTNDYLELDEESKEEIEDLKGVIEEVLEETFFEELLNNMPQDKLFKKNVVNYAKSDGKETAFLDGLYQKCQISGLQYNFYDLINFHTSIKTNPLTILSGISGTGKTQLAYNYASMLNLSEDNNTLLFMPISPAYTEPNDVLGYYNVLEHEYVPADTGLVNFLQRAARPENSDQLFMVIFDEMNLAQVEYWFSPFISILEKNPDARYLRLYDESLEKENDKYKSKIKIGENIIFVGTVNIDDTTKDFSDRLLDRAFMIELNKLSFKEYYQQHEEVNMNYKSQHSNATCKSLSEFMSWTHSNDINYVTSFSMRELEFFDDLDQLIGRYIPEGGISFRVLKNIGNYLLNIPKNEENRNIIPRDKAIDIVVNQSVLTKIRGTENKLLDLVGSIKDDKVENSKLIELLNSYSNLSSFTYIRKTIKKKAKDLMIDGYTN